MDPRRATGTRGKLMVVWGIPVRPDRRQPFSSSLLRVQLPACEVTMEERGMAELEKNDQLLYS